MVHLTIRGIGGNDPLEKIARAVARHPEIRIEAGVIAGDTTWTGRRKPGAKTHSPSFERLREMIRECRVLGLGAAVHLKECYTEMTRSGEHRIIRELAAGADRIQVEDTGYDYEAMDSLRTAAGIPVIARNWTGFTGSAPSRRLEYLHTDIGQVMASDSRYPRPWASIRCGYSGRGVDADVREAAAHAAALGSDRCWLEIERRTVSTATGEIDIAELERVLQDTTRGAENTAPTPAGRTTGSPGEITR